MGEFLRGVLPIDGAVLLSPAMAGLVGRGLRRLAEFDAASERAMAPELRAIAGIFENVARTARLTPTVSASVDNATSALTSTDVEQVALDNDSRTCAPSGGEHDLVDTAEAATILGTTAHNVRDLARRGMLHARRIDRRLYLHRRELETRARKTA